MRGLQGKNVLITGGSSGIGQAIAVRFAEYGANIAINYLTTPDEAAETEEQVHACLARAKEYGVREILVQGDVSSEDDVVHMVGEATERLGGLDILVNNAGIQFSRPSEDLASADFDKVLAVNLRGSFLCAREAIKGFLAEQKPGVVINVSSVHQIIPRPHYLGYSVSKVGMQNLTRTLALEYGGHGRPSKPRDDQLVAVAVRPRRPDRDAQPHHRRDARSGAPACALWAAVRPGTRTR